MVASHAIPTRSSQPRRVLLHSCRIAHNVKSKTLHFADPSSLPIINFWSPHILNGTLISLYIIILLSSDVHCIKIHFAVIHV
jgi:hypothetical protein